MKTPKTLLGMKEVIRIDRVDHGVLSVNKNGLQKATFLIEDSCKPLKNLQEYLVH